MPKLRPRGLCGERIRTGKRTTMDHDHFDALTRHLAAVSRRQLLARLTLGALAIPTLAVGGDSAAAKQCPPCRRKRRAGAGRSVQMAHRAGTAAAAATATATITPAPSTAPAVWSRSRAARSAPPASASTSSRGRAPASSGSRATPTAWKRSATPASSAASPARATCPSAGRRAFEPRRRARTERVSVLATRWPRLVAPGTIGRLPNTGRRKGDSHG